MAKVGMRRLQRELAQAQAHGISPTVHIAPHGNDMTTIDALIIGPPDTPFDGAVLHFRVKVPPEYPLQPPKVRFMNTDGGSLRIHPQLYADGKVCLSILGTWHGPKWSASQSVASVLLSIQSLLTPEPLRCEPGLENCSQEAVDRSNVFITHEVMRVLIIGQLSGHPSWGLSEDVQSLTVAMRSHLEGRRKHLLQRAAELSKRYDKQVMSEPLLLSASSGWRRRYDFASLGTRLAELLPGGGEGERQGDEPEGGEPSDRATPSSSSSAPRQAAPTPPTAESSPGASRPSRKASKEKKGSKRAKRSHAETPEPEEEEAKGHCRICHLSSEESSEPLISPCLCAGSMRHAHAKCILKWLEHSGQASSKRHRCDICRAPFRVKLGGGKPPGYAYFRRDVDVFADPGFDSPGLVAALFISFMQTLSTGLGRVLAQSLFGFAVLCCNPLPPAIGRWLLILLQVPMIGLEILSYAVYCGLLVAKAAVILWGPEWRPSDWGDLGQEFADNLLGGAFDNFYALGLRLDSVIFFAIYFSASHVSCLLGGPSIVHLITRTLLGRSVRISAADRFPSLAFDPGIKEIFPSIQRLFPEMYDVFTTRIHLPVALISLSFNFYAIIGLLRRAFYDSHLVAVDILPAAKARGNRRRAEGSGE